MRTREGIQHSRELKVKSLPSVALDGELMYESIIPMQEELIDEIQRRYKEKNSYSLLYSANLRLSKKLSSRERMNVFRK